MLRVKVGLRAVRVLGLALGLKMGLDPQVPTTISPLQLEVTRYNVRHNPPVCSDEG